MEEKHIVKFNKEGEMIGFIPSSLVKLISALRPDNINDRYTGGYDDAIDDVIEVLNKFEQTNDETN